MKRYILILLLLSIFFSSCYKDINLYDKNTYQPKLGISGMFSVDSTIKVWIYKTASPGNFSKDNIISNATAKLYEDGNLLEQLHYVSLGNCGYYQSASVARAGHDYKIDVQADNMQAWAEDTVPAKPDFQIKGIAIKDTTIYSGYYKPGKSQVWMDAIATISLTNTHDYYYAFAGYAFADTMKNWFRMSAISDMNLTGNMADMQKILLPFDSGAEGLLYTPAYYKQGNVDVNFDFNAVADITHNSITLYFIVVKLSKDLYDFYKSMNMYQRTRGNPFVEPVNVRVNVHGGLGLFAGYSFSLDSIKINF